MWQKHASLLPAHHSYWVAAAHKNMLSLTSLWSLALLCQRVLWQTNEIFCSISIQLGKYQVPKWGASSTTAIPGQPLWLRFCIYSKYKKCGPIWMACCLPYLTFTIKTPGKTRLLQRKPVAFLILVCSFVSCPVPALTCLWCCSFAASPCSTPNALLIAHLMSVSIPQGLNH